MNITNEIYGHSKGAAMGRFKHPRKGVKMNRTTEDFSTPVPPTIMEYYRDVHLDIDILFVNKVPFFLAKQETLDLSIVRQCFLSMMIEYGKDYDQ